MSWPTDPAEQFFGRGLWGWDGSEWRKLSLLWGYTDRFVESLDVSASDIGYVLVASTAVPAGSIYVLEAASMSLAERATTKASISVRVGALYVVLEAAGDLAADTHSVWTGRVTLKEGDMVNMFVQGTLEGDTFVGRVWGHKMAVV